MRAMYRALSNSIFRLTATVTVASLSLTLLAAPSQPALAQSPGTPPIAPTAGSSGLTCDMDEVEFHPTCLRWREEVEAWKRRRDSGGVEAREEPLAGGEERQVRVAADGKWHGAGIIVERGQTYDLRARGKWSIAPTCNSTDASGTGAYNLLCLNLPVFSRALPEHSQAILIARIGETGEPFVVGNALKLTTTKSGSLFLRINDNMPFGLGSGAVTVTVAAVRAIEATPAQQAALAREREETERLRKELEAARRERERLVAEQKAAAESLGLERERKAAEARAEKAEKAEAGNSVADDQLAALVKKLQESNLLAPQTDTELPVIRATLPERVEVGDQVRIAGLVGDQGSPPRLKVNGEPASLFRLRADEQPLAKHTLSFAIEVDAAREGLRSYVLEACDAAGNCISERLSVNVLTANRPNVAARNFALIIGNNDYRNLPDLKTAVADARAVADVLKGRYAFRPENVKLLLNADRSTTLRALFALRSELQPDDRLLIYYAGHGQIDPVTEEGYWQPVDADNREDFTWIANSDIRRTLKGIPAKHVLVIADSCFSGSLTRGAQQFEGVSKDRFYTEIDAPVSRKVISSGGTEPVADSGSGGHSVFTYYLLKALRDNDRPYLASFELFNKLVRAVTNNSNQKPQYGTVSEAGDEGAGDFTFILRSGG